jgi:methyl-accepting chemotaxis protein
MYRKNKADNKLRYIMAIATIATYFFTTLNSNNILAFAFAFCLIIQFGIFADKKLLSFVVLVILATNISNVVLGNLQGRDTVLVMVSLILAFVAQFGNAAIMCITNKENIIFIENLDKEKSKRTEIIDLLNKTVEKLLFSTNFLNKSTSESSEAISQVSKVVEELASSASSQARDTENGSSEALVIAGGIGKIVDATHDLSNTTNETEKLKNNGLNILSELINKTGESNEAVKSLQEIIRTTSNSAEEINATSTIIVSIAEQTNLLALNAAIEAARAGDSGKGFAVVADEIRTLAEQSTESTKKINEVIEELKSNMEDAFNKMEDTINTIDVQTKAIITTQDIFNGLAKSIEVTKLKVEQLNSAGERMNEGKNTIIDILMALSSTALENAAGTEEAATSAEQQASSMGEIKEVTVKLSDLSEELEGIITKLS